MLPKWRPKRHDGIGLHLLRLALPDAVVFDLLDTGLQLEFARHPGILEARVAALPARGWVWIDEVQKVPAVLDEVHRLIERRRWRFALSGSSARKLLRQGANLLAGRASTRYLEPLSFAELGDGFDLRGRLEWGALPMVVNEPAHARDILTSYVHTYVREEIKEEGLVRKVEPFLRFLEIAGALNGQVVNFEHVGREAQVPRKSVVQYFSILAGTPDIGGLRASLAMVAADELGIPYDKVRPIIGDTGSVGFNFLTGGSRSAFSGSMAIVEAAKQIRTELCARAAKLWDMKPAEVEYSGGQVKPIVANDKVKALSLAEFARIAGKTGDPIGGTGRINAQGAGPSFGTHLVDLEVDPETGRVTILRYTVAQDAGKVLHPAYVEGQFQGGAVQGSGWVLNEEYVYGDDGKLQNAGFLDSRMPVASDVPMIDAILVEVANPKHPYGVRGVGETPIVPPLGAIANAMENATGIRFTELPMSPPRVLKALKERGAGKA